MRKNTLKVIFICLLVFSFSLSALAQDIPALPGPGNPPPPQGQQGPSPNPEEEIKAALGILVIDGIIDRKQALKVLEYYRKELAETKNMTPEARQQYQEKSRTEHKDLLSLLVKAGIITKTQAEAIDKALTKTALALPPGQPGISGSGFSALKTTAFYTQNGGNVIKANQNIITSKKDESGVKIADGGTFTLKDSIVTKSGDSSSTENSDFYGLNAGILAESAGKINLANCTINTNGTGANAVFATGAGSLITLSGVTIKTTADSSRGLDATFTGTVNAKNVNITTSGAHSAAIATDRGNGTIIVTGGTMTTSGEGSPGIYSTGDIQVTDANLTATGSEAAVIEGKNSITLTNTTLSGAKKRGVMLYQSFSGDAEVGTSIFKMNSGSLTAQEGPLFYVTNTQAIIELKGATLHANSGILLTASAGNWGTKGSNGGTVTLKANNQILDGNITCDTISSIEAILQNNSILTGSINGDNTAKSTKLTLDKTSIWNVTGDSYLTTLTDDDLTLANIHDNGFTIYYESSAATNSWLGGKSYNLAGGGRLIPVN